MICINHDALLWSILRDYIYKFDKFLGSIVNRYYAGISIYALCCYWLNIIIFCNIDDLIKWSISQTKDNQRVDWATLK